MPPRNNMISCAWTRRQIEGIGRRGGLCGHWIQSSLWALVAGSLLLSACGAATYARGLIVQPRGTTQRVSVRSDGLQANDRSDRPAISNDGAYIAFSSIASNLVNDDTNGHWDVFVFETASGITQRVSVSSSGGQAGGESAHPSLSSDGRFVAFSSNAPDLVPNDSNFSWDIFVHDRLAGQTERVSVDTGGAQANGHSYSPSLSADGRWVAFPSEATNLVDNDTNGTFDVFVHDRLTGVTVRASVSDSGLEGNGLSDEPALAGNGSFVSFQSWADNLVTGDTNEKRDVFVRDLMAQTTFRVSLSSTGLEGNDNSNRPRISADGRYVVFDALANNLVPDDTNATDDIFIHDIITHETSRVSVNSEGIQANGSSGWAAISADGRYAAYYSEATNLTPGDTNGVYDVFLFDRQGQTTTRVSVATDGSEGNGASFERMAVAAYGQYVAFRSDASNLVPNDTNGASDIFVRTAAEPIMTPTATATGTATASPTMSATPGASPSSTPTATSQPSPSPGLTLTGTPPPTPVATHTPTLTPISPRGALLPLIRHDRTPTPIPTPTQTPTPRPTSTPTRTPTPIPPGVMVMDNYTNFVDNANYLHVVGEVRNHTGDHLRSVRISADFFDNNGHLVDTDYTYTYLYYLPAWERTCFHLLLPQPPQWAYYQFEAPSYATGGQPLPNLTVIDDSSTYDPVRGWYTVLGLVRNDNGTPVDFVEPVITLYDGQGGVADCDFTFVNSTDLEPGQLSAFENTSTWRNYADVTGYRIQVDGNPQP